MNKQQRAASQSLTFVAIVVGILVALNVISVFVFGRLDLTRQDLFTLSDSSKQMARNLEDKMEITAYFTEDLPPPFNATERYVRDMLREYESASGGKIQARFVNPDDEEEQKEAEADGVRKVAHQKLENDSVSVQEGYRGIVLRYLGEKETIPVVQDTGGLEYALTLKMKQLTGDKQSIGVLKAEGPSLAQGLSRLREVLPIYELKEVDAAQPIDKELSALLIAAPEAEISEAALKNINRYVMNGGSVGVFGGRYKINLQGPNWSGEPVETGINKLLGPWGLSLGEGMVADAQCERVPMRSSFGLQLPVPYPPLPIVAFTKEQQETPVDYRIPSARIPFSSPIELAKPKDKSIKQVSLANSSERSWLLTGTPIALQPRDPREWQMSGKEGPFTLVASVEGPLPSAFKDGDTPGKALSSVRVLVAGSGSLMRDEFMPQRGQQGGSGLAFISNAIDWLAQERDLIAIRAKTVEDPTLEIPQAVQSAEAEQKDAEGQAIEAIQEGDRVKAEEAKQSFDKAKDEIASASKAWDTKKAIIRWGNTLMLPLLFAGFGVWRWRRRQAMKREIKV